jgi:hypothetical protein
MVEVFDTIAKRLADLKPSIDINKYIEPGTLKEEETTLEGIYFAPENTDKTMGYRDLHGALAKANHPNGKPSFTDDTPEGKKHWPLKLSLMATKGVGLREVWRLAPLPESRLRTDGFNSNAFRTWTSEYSSQFGRLPDVPRRTALHVGMTTTRCNIHIDDAAFVMEHGGSTFLIADLGQHTADELLLKTWLKGVAPGWMKPFLGHVSLVYPNVGNAYGRTGPTSGQLLGWSRRLPLVGGLLDTGILPGELTDVLKKFPLPGLRFDYSIRDTVKLKAIGSCSVVKSKGCSFTVSVSGTF